MSTSKEPEKSAERHGAHSGFHQKSSEYNDGANTTHYLGNDDYPDATNIKEAFSSGGEQKAEDVGKVAYGNEEKNPQSD
jgi:hypothetical protein